MNRLTRHMDGFPDHFPLYELVACEKCKATTTEDERDGYGCPECDCKGDALGRLGQYEATGLTPDEIAALRAESELREWQKTQRRTCPTCAHHLGAEECRINAEGECREGGGFELWEAKDA